MYFKLSTEPGPRMNMLKKKTPGQLIRWTSRTTTVTTKQEEKRPATTKDVDYNDKHKQVETGNTRI